MGEVHQPRAWHRRVEDRGGDVLGRCVEADDGAVGGRAERQVHIDAHQMGLHALRVGQVPSPVVGLLEQPLRGPADANLDTLVRLLGATGLPARTVRRLVGTLFPL
ncbi:hypothetical protein ABZ136_23735, partial [Streptomyces microflavus]